MKKAGNQSGAILISTYIMLAALTAIVAAFLYMNSVQTVGVGVGIPDSKALWLAEAGLQKAIFNLKTPGLSGPCFNGSNPSGENWTTTGCTENLGDGSYTMVVNRWDFALAANGASASDNPAQTNSNIGPAKAIDGSDTTYWESADQPGNNSPQDLMIAFPYPLTINKARFLAPSSDSRPRRYTWAVSSNGSSYTTVVTVNNNGATDVTNTFSVQSSVSYLRLRTTQDGPGGVRRVRVSTLEAIGSKITSTGTVGSSNRKIEQTAVADDATQTAFNEVDWNEI